MLLIESSGTEPVITLCCAPDWMKGGDAGETDWSFLEKSPDRSHFADFADLAATVAQRYPRVRHFVVWNELKGFFDESRNQWDMKAYTDMYNQVYTALKKQDPTVLVGGPYAPMDSWSTASATNSPSSVGGQWGVLDQRSLDAVDYWLRAAVGADFIAVDGGTTTNDELLAEPQIANDKFAVVTRWLAARTTLPIWWMEMYPDVAGQPWDSAYRADVATDALLRFADAGGSTALFWQPEGQGSFASVGLWSSTKDPDGGTPAPLVSRLTQLRQAWYGGEYVQAHWNGRHLLLNQTDKP